MRTAVAAALDKRQVLVLVGIIDTFGGEALDPFGKQSCVVRHLNFLNFFATDVQNGIFTFNQLPLKGGLFAVNIEAFHVLAGRVEEEPGYFETKVLVANFEMSRFE